MGRAGEWAPNCNLVPGSRLVLGARGPDRRGLICAAEAAGAAYKAHSIQLKLARPSADPIRAADFSCARLQSASGRLRWAASALQRPKARPNHRTRFIWQATAGRRPRQSICLAAIGLLLNIEISRPTLGELATKQAR